MAHALAPETTRPAVTDSTWKAIQALAESTPIPAGHAFELYCPIWSKQPAYEILDNGKTSALGVVARCNIDTDLSKAIATRTASITLAHDQESTLSLALRSTSALITGSGIDHPTENGFAFMRPYGVPYLAGSSIKGTLRAAAEYRALFEPDNDWTMADVWWLFGWESQADYWTPTKNTNVEEDRSAAFQQWLNSGSPALHSASVLLETMGHTADNNTKDTIDALRKGSIDLDVYSFRGLLDFWDMPLPDANPATDIITPHFSKYYSGDSAPNETDNAKPIAFLVMAPGANGRLTVQWKSDRPALNELDPVNQLRTCWRDKLEALITDVIKWDGFGAKTAVGYGRFSIDSDQQEEDEAKLQEARNAILEKEAQQRAAELQSTMGEQQYAIFELREQFLSGNLNGTDSINELIRNATGNWSESDRQCLAELAREIYAVNKVGKNPQKKRVLLLKNLLPENNE